MPTPVDALVREKVQRLYEHYQAAADFPHFLSLVFAEKSLDAEGSDAGMLFIVWTAFEVAEENHLP